MTDYGLYGRHAYFFVAIEKGYYKRADLEVEIVRSQGSANTIKQVANGTAQVGFADAFAVVLGRANDEHSGQARRHDLPEAAARRLSCSRIPASQNQRIFEGKTLADTAFSSVPKLFATYAKAAGIDAAKVKWVAANSDALPGMLTIGRVDGIGQFIVGEPLLGRRGGAETGAGLVLFRCGP